MIADPVKKWVLYWYEKLQIEAWARYLFMKLQSAWEWFWSITIVRQLFWWVLDGHALPFWILLGIVIYIPIAWMLLRKPRTERLT